MLRHEVEDMIDRKMMSMLIVLEEIVYACVEKDGHFNLEDFNLKISTVQLKYKDYF